MDRFEYKVSMHEKDAFGQSIVACTQNGECSEEKESPALAMEKFLNENGSQGWELVQIIPGADALVVIWKRRQP